jgi:hypothetical protein
LVRDQTLLKYAKRLRTEQTPLEQKLSPALSPEGEREKSPA